MTNKIATEQYLINLAGGGTNTPTKCATRDRVEFFGLETNDNYANNQLVKEEDIQLSTFQYDFNIHVSITNSGLTSKSYDFVADVYIDGVPDGFITIPRSGTLDYQGATFFDRNFHFNLPTDLTNVSKLLFTGYFYKCNYIMKFVTFLKQVFTSHSGISSKRLCGVVGWFVCLGVLIYCAINVIQAPLMIDTVLLCCMGLLGIDSVTGIWKRFTNNDKSNK